MFISSTSGNDYIGSIRQGRAAVGKNGFKGLAPHDDRVPAREVAKALYVGRDAPDEFVTTADFPILPYRHHCTDFRLHVIPIDTGPMQLPCLK